MEHWSRSEHQGRVCGGDQRWSLVLETRCVFRCERRHSGNWGDNISSAGSSRTWDPPVTHRKSQEPSWASWTGGGETPAIASTDTSGVHSMNIQSADPVNWAWTGKTNRVPMKDLGCWATGGNRTCKITSNGKKHMEENKTRPQQMGQVGCCLPSTAAASAAPSFPKPAPLTGVSRAGDREALE